MSEGRPGPKEMRIDPNAHRRLLRFLNEARAPEDLAYFPQNKIKEAREHTLKGLDIHEPVNLPPPEKLLDFAQAKRLIEERDRIGPLHGFMHIDQVRNILGDEIFARYIEHLLKHMGAMTYGEWHDLGSIQDPNDGTQIKMAHAALLHTGKVLFIEACFPPATSKIVLWDAQNRASVAITIPPPPSDNLYCSGHSFLSEVIWKLVDTAV